MKSSFGLLEIHISVLLFGLSGLFGKFLPLSPLSIVFGRTLFASFVLVLLLLKTGTPITTGSGRNLGVFVILGATLAVHWVTFFHAIQISTVAVGLISFSTFPLFVTFMEPVFFKERLKPVDIVMALAIFLGMVLVVPSPDFGNNITQGAFWGTVSGFTFAVLSLINRKYAGTHPSSLIAFFQNGFAMLFLLPFSLGEMPLLFTGKNLILTAFLGIFCTALAHTLFIKGLTHIKAQTASIIAGLEPVYGTLFALVLLGEVPALPTAAGGVIIIVTTVAASIPPKTASSHTRETCK